MGAAGELWTCPHCGEQILRSAVICPACQRRLHVNALAGPSSAQVTVSPLTVEGIIRNPEAETAWEFSVLVEVRDQRGEILAKRVVGVGAIHPGDLRVFSIRVEVQKPEKLSTVAVSSRLPRVE